jgi:hypothetical protein
MYTDAGISVEMSPPPAGTLPVGQATTVRTSAPALSHAVFVMIW